MKITKKQNELFEKYKTGKYKIFALGGGTGSAKTMGILMLINAICESLPGVRIAVFRKSEKNIKDNTLPSFRKMLALLGKKVSVVDLEARYSNGSKIIFRWADISKDPDCDNVKGGEYTIIFFNEANQIDRKYISIAKTRVGRWNEITVNDKKIKIKPAIFLDFNPTNNWVKEDYYDKHIDSTLPEDTFFQLSLPTDNQFLDKDYLEMLETLPEAEYNRFVKGNWEYNDDPNQLIKFDWIKANLTEPNTQSNLTEPNTQANHAGVDIAREGNDKSIISYRFNNIQTRLEEINTQNLEVAGDIVMTRAKEYNIEPTQIIADKVGVGGGLIDHCRHNNFMIKEYSGGDASTDKTGLFLFKNKRAESHWQFREMLRLDEIKILNNPELIKELSNIRYFVKDKYIQIEAKAEFKKRLGKSPDYSDATIMDFTDTQATMDVIEIPDMPIPETMNLMNRDF